MTGKQKAIQRLLDQTREARENSSNGYAATPKSPWTSSVVNAKGVGNAMLGLGIVRHWRWDELSVRSIKRCLLSPGEPDWVPHRPKTALQRLAEAAE